MDSPISQLPTAAVVDPEALVPIVQGGVTSKIKASELSKGARTSAALVEVTPAGGIASTDVQAALVELDSEKARSDALAGTGGASLIKTIATFTGSVARTIESVLRDFFNARSIGTASDGTTDDTSTLTSFFSGNASFRGKMTIPYGTKFNKATVFGALPVGVVLWDESGINTGQPPGYKNKIIRMWTNDSGSDDASFEIGSSHHPCLRLNNSGTAGTGSATAYYHSVIRSAGFRWNNDPIDGMQQITFKSPRGNLWRTADLVDTAYLYATSGAAQWTASTVYAANAIVNTSDGNVYQTTAGGTSGATKPTGTGTGISDGAVLWNYLGPWSASRTVFGYDEDGYGFIIGLTTGTLGAQTATKKGLSINADDASGDTYTRDDQRSIDHWRLSAANGLQTGALMAMRYGGALSGATPTLSTNFHSVNNGAATNMTDLALLSQKWKASTAYALNDVVNTTDGNTYKATAAGTSGTTKPTGTGSGISDGTVTWQYIGAAQVRASIVYLYFSNGNTTVMNAGGNFNLKGNVNVTPAAGSIMGFLLEPTLSGGWIEVSRNF